MSCHENLLLSNNKERKKKYNNNNVQKYIFCSFPEIILIMRCFGRGEEGGGRGGRREGGGKGGPRWGGVGLGGGVCAANRIGSTKKKKKK